MKSSELELFVDRSTKKIIFTKQESSQYIILQFQQLKHWFWQLQKLTELVVGIGLLGTK